MRESQAIGRAAELAAELGEGWEPRVWENLGWHFEVRKDGWSIFPSFSSLNKDEIFAYTAFLREPQTDQPVNYWADRGKTVVEAMENTVKKAINEMAPKSAALVAGIRTMHEQKQRSEG